VLGRWQRHLVCVSSVVTRRHWSSVSFLPAVFMHAAFFIGLGVLFIVACSVAGGLFSAVVMSARKISK
jgi:hypothetical protein